jgi:hypothetical protein
MSKMKEILIGISVFTIVVLGMYGVTEVSKPRYLEQGQYCVDQDLPCKEGLECRSDCYMDTVTYKVTCPPDFKCLPKDGTQGDCSEFEEVSCIKEYSAMGKDYQYWEYREICGNDGNTYMNRCQPCDLGNIETYTYGMCD